MDLVINGSLVTLAPFSGEGLGNKWRWSWNEKGGRYDSWTRRDLVRVWQVQRSLQETWTGRDTHKELVVRSAGS